MGMHVTGIRYRCTWMIDAPSFKGYGLPLRDDSVKGIVCLAHMLQVMIEWFNIPCG